tara:strand:+ start:206 stop:598 length:393 start_codon:yes stop_codon:yes gene_type:complete
MIQRIQTVFLFIIVIVSVIGFFFLPPLDFYILGLLVPTLLKSYIILTSSLALLSLMIFKHRKTQLIINRLHFFLQVAMTGVLIFGLLNANELNSFLLWLLMPFQAMVLLILSSRAIQKDDDLIRSIDRLR